MHAERVICLQVLHVCVYSRLRQHRVADALRRDALHVFTTETQNDSDARDVSLVRRIANPDARRLSSGELRRRDVHRLRCAVLRVRRGRDDTWRWRDHARLSHMDHTDLLLLLLASPHQLHVPGSSRA